MRSFVLSTEGGITLHPNRKKTFPITFYPLFMPRFNFVIFKNDQINHYCGMFINLKPNFYSKKQRRISEGDSPFVFLGEK